MKLLDSDTYISDIKKAIKKCNTEVLKNKTVVVTGGLGLVCSAVVDLLFFINEEYDANINIIVACRDRHEFNERYGGKNIAFLYYDALKGFDSDMVPDYIIHGAGIASPELYMTNPVETFSTNVFGIRNILEYSKEKNIKRILYISSSEIYGINGDVSLFTEEDYGKIDSNRIRSCYPVAKQAAEMLCRSYSSEYNIDTVIVRPGHVFGPTASQKDHRISSDFAYKAARGMKLEMKSPGLQKRSYCYSVDAATAILSVLTYGVKGESYNISSDDPVTIAEMAKILSDAGKAELITAVPNSDDVKSFNPMNNSALDGSKIKKLGYSQSFTTKEGLEHTVNILKEIL